ncbi:hypothetical protein AHAS_Ahas18G0157900 [Arachis hypogaea]
MIVKGLSHIHRKGIVYCDLMPENILLFPSLDKESANYQLKIADFGLSKTKEEKVDVEVWKSKPRGTPSYLPPLPAWGESFLLTKEYLRFFIEYLELSPKKPKGISVFCY